MAKTTEIQILNLSPKNYSLKTFTEFKNLFYVCINMSTPLPVRSGRSGWTFYFCSYA
jgi:hypothetical protein